MTNMFNKILHYGCVTLKYPKEPLDTTYVSGRPIIDDTACTRCGSCVANCPTSALVLAETSPSEKPAKPGILLDQCIFCFHCVQVCPNQAITINHDFELAQNSRAALQDFSRSPSQEEPLDALGSKVEKRIQQILGRSLNIRVVDSGSCNGCDYEINGLNNPFNDLERFGLRFVPSPRHADMLLVTGTATRNLEEALCSTYDATPSPKLVVAVGACACSGGIFRDSYATKNGIDALIPVDVYIPGCPPRPHAILYGILKALNRKW